MSYSVDPIRLSGSTMPPSLSLTGEFPSYVEVGDTVRANVNPGQLEARQAKFTVRRIESKSSIIADFECYV